MKPTFTRLPICDLTIIFCPNCKKGHQIQLNQKECDICGVALEWEEVKKEIEKAIELERGKV